MKTINKINLLFACCALLLLASCKDDIVRDPSPTTNPKSTNVHFGVSNTSTPILEIDQTSFKVSIRREIATEAQTVTLATSNVYGEVFQIPNQVSFAAGEDSVDIEVTVKGMELMKKYQISITIDPEQTLPYTIQSVIPKINLVVLKEDFAPFAEGTYTSEFFEDNWPATLEYSPATKIYRFKDCWAAGYNVTFKWAGTNSSEVNIIGTLSKEEDYIYLATGYEHSKYGMVYAYYPLNDINYFNETTQTFTFPIDWQVSAGDFGLYVDTYAITKVL